MPSLRKVFNGPVGAESTNNADVNTERTSPANNAQIENNDGQSTNTGNANNLLIRSDSRADSTAGDSIASAPTKKVKSSCYMGVTATKEGKYRAQLSVNAKMLYAGQYRLECDAALAYDKLMESKSIDIPSVRRRAVNFCSFDEYERAKAKELQERRLEGSNLGFDLAALSAKVKDRIDAFLKKRQSEVEALNKSDIAEVGASQSGIASNDSKPTASVGNSSPAPPEDTSFTTKKVPTSRFVGVYFSKNAKKYVAQVSIEGKDVYGGYYQLETDAAFAADEMMKQLVNSDGYTKKPNFKIIEEYHRARSIELQEKELDSAICLDVASLTAKVQGRIDVFVKKRESQGMQTPATGKQNKGENNYGSFDGHEITKRPNSRLDNPVIGTCSEDVEKKSSSSSFRGVSYIKSQKIFTVQVPINGKQCFGGHHKLETGAAYSYDLITKHFVDNSKAYRDISEDGRKRLNFDSVDRYLDARSKELTERGITDDNSTDPALLTQRVQKYIDAIIKKHGLSVYFYGVKFIPATNKYEAIIGKQNKSSLGVYFTAADAARAFDEGIAAEELRGKRRPYLKCNFPSKDVYCKVRDRELQESGIGLEVAGSVEGVTKQINLHLKKLQLAVDNAQMETMKAPQEMPISTTPEQNNDGVDHKRKQNEKSKSMRKKRRIEKLNAKTGALTKKWGSMFPERDENSSDLMRAHEQAIGLQLMELASVNNETPPPRNLSPMLVDEDASSGAHESTAVDLESKSKDSSPTPGANDIHPNDGTESNANPMVEEKESNSDNDSLFDALDEDVEPSSFDHNAPTENNEVEGTGAINEGPASQLSAGGMENVDGEEPPTADATQRHVAADPNFVRPPREQIDEAKLMPLQAEQVNQSQFPIGTIVWFNLHPWHDGESFQCGSVVSASFLWMAETMMCQVYYKILLDGGTTCWVNKEKLVYAPESPIYYSPSSFVVESDRVRGEILVCRTTSSEFSYSVSVTASDDDTCEYKVIDDVTAKQVKSTKCIV